MLFLGLMFCVGKFSVEKNASKFVLADADVPDEIFRLTGYPLHDFMMKTLIKLVDITGWFFLGWYLGT